MAEKLVLVRHAKTEARGADIADVDRRLTEAGKRSCRIAAKRIAPLVADDLEAAGCASRGYAGPCIWTSPAVRARQTAKLLAKALEAEKRDALGSGAHLDLEVHESLYDTDCDAFLDEVAAVRGTVVAVGHNPFLEDVVERLTGTSVHLGKAAAVAIDLDAERGAVSWYVEGPKHARWQTIVDLEAACAAVAQRMHDNSAWLESDPADPEALHQWRVSLRVARSLEAFIEPYCEGGYARRLRGLLKDLQSQTSRLREYDVLADLLDDPDVLARYTDAAELAAALDPVREEERRRFNKYFAQKKTLKARRKAIRLVGEPVWRDAVNAHGLSDDEVCMHFDALAALYDRDLASCDFTDEEATHSIRKRSKQRRYVARELGALLGEERLQSGLEAKQTQELLGRLCDARVNRNIAVELLPKAPDGKLGDFAASQQAIADQLVGELMVGE